ncbi:hypothetical protein [Streptomyces sp. NBC_00057]|uniref:hypothetical protein n=1 Tax=Streptomyces sp. NBC_00057 TaxID=2975634 RepID=UPI0032537DCB
MFGVTSKSNARRDFSRGKPTALIRRSERRRARSPQLQKRLQPVVELNRAVAVAMANGPQEALSIMDGPAVSGRLSGAHLLPTVRGKLLVRLGRTAEAWAEPGLAARLCRNLREWSVLLRKAAELV